MDNNKQLRCPHCNSSDIIPCDNGKLKCRYCSFEFEDKVLEGINIDPKVLNDHYRGLSTYEIDDKDIVTYKCYNCGAEVVLNIKDTDYRCHWCHSVLSSSNKIDNGYSPDMILPFKISKEDARRKMEKFVKKRRMFANRKFKKAFKKDNIMGVYFPYMVVDFNCHAFYSGEGEIQLKKYSYGRSENSVTYYDANVYKVIREFDISISDFVIEANSQRLDSYNKGATNNIINSILPFDTENCVKFKSNYLIGYSSEKRDLSAEDLEDAVEKRLKDIIRLEASMDAKQYDRGVNWEKEELDVKGSQWLSAYLPVWLYSYEVKRWKKKTIHFIAVNGRTGEIMGSIPIAKILLLFISTVAELLAIAFFIEYIYFSLYPEKITFISSLLVFLLLLIGPAIYKTINYFYRNNSAKHKYEKETKNEISNLVKTDEFKYKREGLTTEKIFGCNTDILKGEYIRIKK